MDSRNRNRMSFTAAGPSSERRSFGGFLTRHQLFMLAVLSAAGWLALMGAVVLVAHLVSGYHSW